MIWLDGWMDGKAAYLLLEASAAFLPFRTPFSTGLLRTRHQHRGDHAEVNLLLAVVMIDGLSSEYAPQLGGVCAPCVPLAFADLRRHEVRRSFLPDRPPATFINTTRDS